MDDRVGQRLLESGPGLLPLAPISAVAEPELPGVIERMKERMQGQPPAQVNDLWTATYLLMGLRYEQALVNQLLQGVIAMEESTTYQYLIAKGEQQGALRELRKTLLVQGHERFGAPPAEVKTSIEDISDLERLEQLTIRLLHVGSWQELLA